MAKFGKIIYAAPFAVFGLFHFMNGSAMAGMVPIPGGVLWVYVTGLALMAASVAILSGKMAGLASTLLGVMLLIFVVSIHLMGVINAADQMAMQGAMTNMLKDLALAGAAFYLAGTMEGGAASAPAAAYDDI